MADETEQLKQRFSQLLAKVPNYRKLTQAELDQLKSTFDRWWDTLWSAIDFLSRMRPEMLDYAPYHTAVEAVNRIDGLTQAVAEVVGFDPMGPGDSRSRRDDAGRQLIESYKGTFDACAGMLAYYQLAVGPNAAAEKVDRIDNALNRAEEAVRDLERLQVVAQESARKVGVAAHAEVFQEEYKRFHWAATRWLFFAAVLAGLGGWYILDFILNNSLPLSESAAATAKMTDLQLYSWIGTKLFLVSFFYVALAFLIKNYSATRHNATVNKHRASAMQTFELFKAAAVGPETQDAVLRQATEAIFAPQKTGFIGKEIPPTPLHQITEVVGRRVTSSSE